MKTWMVVGISFLSGLGAGVGASYIYFSNKFDKRINAELEAINASYGDILDKYKERLKKAEEALSDGVSTIENIKKTGVVPEDAVHNYNAYSSSVKLDPSVMVDKSSIKEPEKREAKVLSSEEEAYLTGAELSTNHEIHKGDLPKLIKREEYGNDGTLAKKTLQFYVYDNILVDEESKEEVLDQRQMVGDCLDKFGFRTNDDEDEIYVRNSKLGFDFTVIKIFDSYTSGGY